MAEIEVIKATRVPGTHVTGRSQNQSIRVAAYCRVSTDDEEQLESYKSQVKYYTDLIQQNKQWKLVDIYADEAQTGTMVKKRENFQRMINDCLAGKIDFIITKSISRFARNTLDVLKYVRMLQDHHIAIRFEEENIDTMKMDGELLLSVLSAVYQQEVVNTSANVKKGLKMKMRRGELVGYNGCLGYDYDPDTKEISVNPEQAKIVKLIFKRYLEGCGSSMIAKELKSLGYKSTRGKDSWSNSTIMGILKNEKYKGDLLMGKTFTVSPITKKRLSNFGDEDQFYVHDHHEAIISAEDFERVQEIIRKRQASKKYRFFAPGVHLDGSHRYVFSGKLICGFCKNSLTRRTRVVHQNEKEVVWQCIQATKYGIKNCPESKAVPEKTIENAFVDSYRRTCEGNQDILKEAMKRLEDVLEPDIYKKELQQLNRDIKKAEEKLDGLIDLRLEKTITKDAYEEKYKKMDREIEALKERQLKRDFSEREDKEERLAKFHQMLKNNEILDEFDPDIFLSIVDYVMVGGYNKEGVAKPDQLCFIYKTGIKDGRDAKDFDLPERKNRRKKRQSKNDSEENQTPVERLSVIKNIISSKTQACRTRLVDFQPCSENVSMNSQPSSGDTRREYCVATTKNIQESLIFSTSSPISALREIWMETPKKSLKTSSKWRYGYIWYW